MLKGLHTSKESCKLVIRNKINNSAMKNVIDKDTTKVSKKAVKNEGVILAPIDKKVLALELQKKRQSEKIEAQNKAYEFLGTKTVNGKVINPSKKTVKAQTTIELYIDKENRSLNETKLLTNALSKIDSLSASKVYSRMVASTILHEYFLELSGAKQLPTFKEFAEKLPVKFAYSEWDILGALTKMNPKHKLNQKIERQNKAVKAK